MAQTLSGAEMVLYGALFLGLLAFLAFVLWLVER
jgi:hypothetical protein